MVENQEIEKKKEFAFRGKQIEDLKRLDIREFAKYLNSRERRTIMRNFQTIEKFVKESLKKGDKTIRTHLRDIIIVPQMVGMTISVHNGKEFNPVKIITEMLGHRLGEFNATRRPVKHGAPGVGATKSSAAMSVK